MASFRVSTQPLPPIVCQAGAISRLGASVKQLGGSKAFLVTDPGLVQAGLVDKVTGMLKDAGIEVKASPEVPANPTFTAVSKGIDILASMGPGTVMVTLGGGSAMDCGKAIAVIHADGGRDDIQ